MVLTIVLTMSFALPILAGERDHSLRIEAVNTLGKSSVYGVYLAALAAERSWDLQQAATLMIRVLEDKPNDKRLLGQSFRLSLMAGLGEQSGELANRLEAVGGEDMTAKFLLAIKNINDKNYVAARDRLSNQWGKGLAEYASPILTAWTAFGIGDVDGALSVLTQLRDSDGFGVLRRLQEGMINDLADRTTAAEAAYRELVVDPSESSLRAVRALGSFLERSGRIEQARTIYETYLASHPGNILLENELERMASHRLPRSLVNTPAEGIAEGLFHLASVIPRDRGDDLALMYAQLSLAARPDFELSKLLVGDLLDSRKRFVEAIDLYRSIEPESLYRWTAQLRIADNLNELENLDGAVRLLRIMADEQSDRPEPLIKLGNLLRYNHRFHDAIRAYDRAFDRIDTIKKSDWSLYYNLGIALERTKQWARAEDNFLKALELEPDQPFVLNYLGYSWVEQGRNLGRARKMIEKAVSQRREDGYIVDSLGWVLYRLGEWEDAARHLERAVLLRPQDAVINDHLGDALWRVGRRNEARFQWNRALTLEPDANLVKGIENKLENGLGEPVVLKPGG